MSSNVTLGKQITRTTRINSYKVGRREAEIIMKRNFHHLLLRLRLANEREKNALGQLSRFRYSRERFAFLDSSSLLLLLLFSPDVHADYKCLKPVALR